MRIPIILGGLIAVGAGCGPTAISRGPVGPPALRVPVPARVTEENFDTHRDVYAALPVASVDRKPFRDRLLAHLFSRSRRQLKADHEQEAMESFKRSAALFDAAEVFEGTARHAGLAEFAGRMVSLYSPRGDEARVLLPLCVQMSLQPERRELTAKFHQIYTWLNEADRQVHGMGRQWSRLIRVMEQTAQIWPSAFVLDKLRRLYIEQKLTIARVVHVSPYRHLRGTVSALFQSGFFGFKVARLYLTVDQPAVALRRLQEIATEPTQNEELRELLQRAVAPGAAMADHLRLADFFSEQGRESRSKVNLDRRVALRVCRAAQQRFAPHAKLFACVGELAAQLKHNYLAMINLEKAVALAPDDRTFAERLARAYQQRLKNMIWDEQLDQAGRELTRIERFYRRTEKRFGKPLLPPLSRVHLAIGHGFYNAGRVDEAASAFKRSIDAKAASSALALIQLGLIYVKKGQPQAAFKYLAAAERVPMPSVGARLYWQGRIEGLRARAYQLANKAAEMRRANGRAVEAWKQFQTLEIQAEGRAEAYIHEARSLYALGRRAEAMNALDRAIDVQPDRKETYADVIALLATHGHLPEALDAYHRALGRSKVSEYLKSYCSFWIIGLARRAGLAPDPLATRHLRGVLGKAWYRELARFTLGEVSYEELLSKAKTKGNQAELYFYRAEKLLAQGKLQEAQTMWRKVLQTEMMAFYEFDMAAHNLRHGPSSVAKRPLDRQAGKAKRRSGPSAPSNSP
jgi:tetratricopeptide (TPR) repeat protein